MKFIIPGPPLSKAAHKSFIISKKAKNGTSYPRVINYNSQAEQFEEVRGLLSFQFQKALNSENKQIQMEASNLTSGQFFVVRLAIYLPSPDSATNSTRNRISWGLLHPSKKDTDNIAKFYLDCIKKTLIADDHMIVDLYAFKRHSKNPRIEIDIMKKSDDVTPLHDKIISIFSYEDIQQMVSIISRYRLLGEKNIPQSCNMIADLALNFADKLSKTKKY